MQKHGFILKETFAKLNNARLLKRQSIYIFNTVRPGQVFARTPSRALFDQLLHFFELTPPKLAKLISTRGPLFPAYSGRAKNLLTAPLYSAYFSTSRKLLAPLGFNNIHIDLLFIAIFGIFSRTLASSKVPRKVNNQSS